MCLLFMMAHSYRSTFYLCFVSTKELNSKLDCYLDLQRLVANITYFVGCVKKMTVLDHGLMNDTLRKSFLLPESITRRHLYKRRSTHNSAHINPPKRQTFAANMLNGYATNDNHYRSTEMAQVKYQLESNSISNRLFKECPVARISNVGNTCFLNSVLYTLRFAPTFLHNLHHLIGDLTLINSRLSQNKMKSSSLGRNVGSVSGPSSRSTSSKDLLLLGT